MTDLSNVTFDPQNPDALFSQDQWLNQFSNFNNKPIPWPSSYTGWPTDAMGNPIAPSGQGGIGSDYAASARNIPPAAESPTPGTTINSNPQIDYSKLGQQGPAIQELMNNYQAAQAKLSPQQMYNQQQANLVRQQNIQNQNTLATVRGAQGGFGNQPGGAFNPGVTNYTAPMQMAAPQQAASAAPAAPGGLTYPQVLAMLANPGKVTTPGATVPASPTSAQPGAGVNNAFLGQAKPGMNQNFLSALAALQGRGRG